MGFRRSLARNDEPGMDIRGTRELSKPEHFFME
jgi:hypothetical protein